MKRWATLLGIVYTENKGKLLAGQQEHELKRCIAPHPLFGILFDTTTPTVYHEYSDNLFEKWFTCVRHQLLGHLFKGSIIGSV